MKARHVVGWFSVAWLAGVFLRLCQVARGSWVYWLAPVWLCVASIVALAIFVVGISLLERRRQARERRQLARSRFRVFRALDTEFLDITHRRGWHRPETRFRL